MAKQLADPFRPLQRKFWLIERIGWAALTVILIWAVAGGAGGGVLAHRHLQGSGIEVSYDRFARKGALTQIDLRWSAMAGNELAIVIDAAFVDRMRIDFATSGLHPVRAGDTVTLNLGRAARPGHLTLNANPVATGSSSSVIRVGDEPLGTLTVLVFP